MARCRQLRFTPLQKRDSGLADSECIERRRSRRLGCNPSIRSPAYVWSSFPRKRESICSDAKSDGGLPRSRSAVQGIEKECFRANPYGRQLAKKYVQSEIGEFTANSSLPCLQGRVGVGRVLARSLPARVHPLPTSLPDRVEDRLCKQGEELIFRMIFALANVAKISWTAVRFRGNDGHGGDDSSRCH